jgi:hypothetical protein
VTNHICFASTLVTGQQETAGRSLPIYPSPFPASAALETPAWGKKRTRHKKPTAINPTSQRAGRRRAARSEPRAQGERVKASPRGHRHRHRHRQRPAPSELTRDHMHGRFRCPCFLEGEQVSVTAVATRQDPVAVDPRWNWGMKENAFPSTTGRSVRGIAIALLANEVIGSPQENG